MQANQHEQNYSTVCLLHCKGLITWRISARAEISARLLKQILLGPDYMSRAASVWAGPVVM